MTTGSFEGWRGSEQWKGLCVTQLPDVGAQRDPASQSLSGLWGCGREGQWYDLSVRREWVIPPPPSQLAGQGGARDDH